MSWPGLVLFAIAGWFIWDGYSHPYPQIGRQWTLEDGSVCRTFKGEHGVTCVKP